MLQLKEQMYVKDERMNRILKMNLYIIDIHSDSEILKDTIKTVTALWTTFFVCSFW